eukprot:2676533-Pleurochrysis_carterae.AAC.1
MRGWRPLSLKRTPCAGEACQVEDREAVGGDEAVECEDLTHLQRRHQGAPARAAAAAIQRGGG